MGLFGFGKKKDKNKEIVEQEVQIEEVVDVASDCLCGEVCEDNCGDKTPLILEKTEEVKEVQKETAPKVKLSSKKEKPAPKPAKEKGVFKKIFGGLAKTASSIGSGISSIFVGSEFDEDFYEDLLAVLIQSDMGVEAAEIIIDNLKAQVKKQSIKTEEELKQVLAKSIAEILQGFEEDGINDGFADIEKCILLIVGVNGVGKTTSIGKLSHHFKENGKSVLVVAGDTFRAAASEQLAEWTKRAGVRIVKHTEGADPASVVFDALESAKAKKDDIVIVDTAGRLHNKAHLMEELKKIDRVIERNMPDMPRKKLLVVDATTGQNALSQVEIFNNAVDLDGVILTKLDGTAKGGVVITIKQKFNLPVLFVGVGEALDDLLPFDATAFAKGIVGVD